MSDLNNRRSLITINEEDSPKRLISAPTLYCLFALGVILVMVGTFITAHSYIQHPPHDHHVKTEEILRIVGPIILGCGGVFLLGISCLCLVVFKKNKKIRNVDPGDLFSVGASTFFDHQHLSHPADALHAADSSGRTVLGIDNVGGPNAQDDPITFLTNVVVHERRRKMSKNNPQYKIIHGDLLSSKYQAKTSDSSNTAYASFELEGGGDVQRTKYPDDGDISKGNSFRHLGLREMRRVADCQNLTSEENCQDGHGEYSPVPIKRERVQSMTGPRPQLRVENDLENLRRGASLTPLGREARRQELRRRQETLRLKIEKEKQSNSDGWNSLSLRRKKKKKGEPTSDQPVIHHLPGYTPEIIDNLIQIAEKTNFKKSVTFESSPVNPTDKTAGGTDPSLNYSSNDTYAPPRFPDHYDHSKKSSYPLGEFSSSGEESSDVKTRSAKRRRTKQKKQRRESFQKADVVSNSLRKNLPSNKDTSSFGGQQFSAVSLEGKEDPSPPTRYQMGRSDFKNPEEEFHFPDPDAGNALNKDSENGLVRREEAMRTRERRERVETEGNVSGYHDIPSSIPSSRDPYRHPSSSSPEVPSSSSPSISSPSCSPQVLPSPPTPSDARFEAAGIMRHLLLDQGSSDPYVRDHRRQGGSRSNRLSIISSQTEPCESDEEWRIKRKSEIERKIEQTENE